MPQVNSRLRMLVKTPASWVAADPVLLLGELGIIDNGVGVAPGLVVGDGVSTYSQLVPFSGGGGGGGGGGATTLAELTDRVTYSLATVNNSIAQGLAGKQYALFDSGPNQNFKTINNLSLFGTGNLTLGGGGGTAAYTDLTDATSVNLPTINTPLQSALALLAPRANPVFTGSVTVPTAAPGNSSTNAASTAFVSAALAAAVAGLLDLKTSLDGSTNPNYPAASKGDAYIVTVAGKVGGASGKSVDISDMVVAIADNAGGNEATVGTSWIVLEHNLVGALIASNNLSDIGSSSSALTNLGFSTFVKTLIDDADAATARATLGAAASSSPTFTGSVTSDGAQINPANAMAAFVVDTTKYLNTKSIGADQPFTFSANPATANTWFALAITNTDTLPHVVTLPSFFSVVTQGARTTVPIAASGRLYLVFRWDGSGYIGFGDGGAFYNFGSASNPTVTDDSSKGYSAGSLWGNTSTNAFYWCESASVGAAVWNAVSGSATTIFAAEATVASATTTDIGAAASVIVQITGTTTITGLGTAAAGTYRLGRFAAALTLTHNATSLILPGGANITTAAGDRFAAYSLGSGNWFVWIYQRADGTALVGSSTATVAYEDVAGTTYTLLAADLGKNKRFTNAAGCVLSIPTGLGVGFNCLWTRASGAGPLTFAPGAGTPTVAASDGFGSLIATITRAGSIFQEASETYLIAGGLGSVVKFPGSTSGVQTLQAPAVAGSAVHTLPPTTGTLASLDVKQSFSKAQAVTTVTLTDAATVAVDASLSNSFYLAIAGNRTLGAPTNPTDGQVLTIIVKQDATGSRTLAFNAIYLHEGGTDPVLSTAANAVDMLSYKYNSTVAAWIGGMACKGAA